MMSPCRPGEEYCVFARECYNKNTQVCCGDMIRNKNESLGCCLIRGKERAKFYKTQSHMCCGKEILERSPGQVCCGGQLRSASSGICCRDNWNGHTAGENVRCCGNKWFNIATQECCESGDHSQVHARGQDTACCDLDVYNTKTQRCDPSGKVWPMFQYQCGEQMYNSTQQICCDDHLHNKPSESHKCCGSRLHDENKETCCRDRKHAKTWLTKSGGECCGTFYIDPETQTCCDKKVMTKDRLNGLTECCGQELYNPQTSLCCNGQIHLVRDTSRYTCCEGKVMEKNTLQCIDGHIHPLSEKKCKHEESDCVCDGLKINSIQALCCHAVVVKKDKPYHDGCCRHGDMVDTYSLTGKDFSPCHTGAPGKLCNDIYNPKVEICCNGKRLSKKYFGCCAEKVFVKTSTTMCENGNVVYKRNKENDVIKETSHPISCETVCTKKLPRNFKNQAVVLAKLKRFKRKGPQPYIGGKNVQNLKNGGGVGKILRVRVDLSPQCARQCRLYKGDEFLVISSSSGKRRSGKVRYTLQEGDSLVKLTPSNRRTLRKKARWWCRKQCRKQGRTKRTCRKCNNNISL
ncbi:uncharacterized protein LOC135468150 isoform X2 [Liolophura sinensis]